MKTLLDITSNRLARQFQDGEVDIEQLASLALDTQELVEEKIRSKMDYIDLRNGYYTIIYIDNGEKYMTHLEKMYPDDAIIFNKHSELDYIVETYFKVENERKQMEHYKDILNNIPADDMIYFSNSMSKALYSLEHINGRRIQEMYIVEPFLIIHLK